MNEIPTWSEVRQDDIVEGSNGSLWAVDRIDEIDERGRLLRPRRITMTHVTTGDSRSGQPDPDKPVVVVVSAAEALEAAVAVTKVSLGGQEVGTRFGPLPGQNEQEEWICPTDYEHPGGFMGHLYVLHGVHGGAVAGLHLGALRRLHDEISAPARRAGTYVPHVHDPRYAEVAKERLSA
jgi:hypothetical protein